MTARLDFDVDGLRWPHRAMSRFVQSAGMRWHIQEFGSGPLLLLLHGTAASTHSWRGLAPLLARDHRVLALDLPGHGFTDRLPGASNTLPNMAGAVTQVLRDLGVTPLAAVGHSAGAAILVRMARDGALKSRTQLVGLNAALLPYGGFPGRLFLPVARALAANALLARVLTWRAGDLKSVERVLASTGSPIDRAGVELYATLFRNGAHVAAAMDMMAHWDLDDMVRDIASLQQPLALLACGGDLAVRADDTFTIRDSAPAVTVHFVRGLGHLAHEEQPETIASLVLGILAGAMASSAA